MSHFNEKYFNVSSDKIELRIIGTYEQEGESLPYYWWNIYLRAKSVKIGAISLRLGHNNHSYYNGNIGFEIDEAYRGHHYAFFACKMVLDIAKKHDMDKLYLTCKHDNIASSKTIEKLGGRFIEEVVPPMDYIYYYEGIEKQKYMK